MRATLDVGYRHVETVRDYDDERYVGSGLRDAGVDHVADNLAARDLELDDEAVERIEAVARRERVVDPSWAPRDD